MSDRLPPLTALRAFEAAARHMSFAKAAEELSVTPAALSYQIKGLEEHLGAPLFQRLNRAVALTEAGLALQPGASDGFDALRRGWLAARRATETRALTVTAGPAFTAKWLAPRLFTFAAQHPEIELRFVATLRSMDFTRDDVDLAIRFGTGRDEGLFSEELYRGWITPMATPGVAQRLTRPEDLFEETLIHDESLDFLPRPPNWQLWFETLGLTPPEIRGPRFSQADHALDAALDGNGVALGRSSIALNHLKNGTLVTPFDLALTYDAHYRIVCLPGSEDRPHTAAFRTWLKAEMTQDAALAEGRRIVHIA